MHTSKHYYFQNLFKYQTTCSSEAIWKRLNIILNRSSNQDTAVLEIVLNGEQKTGKRTCQ